MRTTTDLEKPKLCNNCLLREEQRTPRKEETMQNNVDILIRCTREEQIEIEEICITENKDFSRYFLELHRTKKSINKIMKEPAGELISASPVREEYFKEDNKKNEEKSKGKKK